MIEQKQTQLPESERSVAYTNYKSRVIQVPDQWNDQLDRQDFEDRFGSPASSNYVHEAMERVIGCFEQSNDVLDRALEFFLERAGHPLPDCGQALPAQEKIEWLNDLVTVADLSEAVESRFFGDLAQCHLVESERRRVMRLYRE